MCYNCIGRYLWTLAGTNCGSDADKSHEGLPDISRSGAEMDSPVRYARSGDVSIAYRIFGQGPRDIVLIPGTLSHVELLWEVPSHEHLLKRLTAFARVIVFDKRGQGFRIASPNRLSKNELATCAQLWMRPVLIAQPYTVGPKVVLCVSCLQPPIRPGPLR